MAAVRAVELILAWRYPSAPLPGVFLPRGLKRWALLPNWNRGSRWIPSWSGASVLSSVLFNLRSGHLLQVEWWQEEHCWSGKGMVVLTLSKTLWGHLVENVFSVGTIAEELPIIDGEQRKADKASAKDETFRVGRIRGPRGHLWKMFPVFYWLVLMGEKEKKKDFSNKIYKMSHLYLQDCSPPWQPQWTLSIEERSWRTSEKGDKLKDESIGTDVHWQHGGRGAQGWRAVKLEKVYVT